MWVIKGPAAKDVCDQHVGVTRRDVLRAVVPACWA